MAQLKEGSIIKKSTGDEVIATFNDIPTDLSQLNQDENNRLATDVEKTSWNNKQNALGYTAENVSNKGSANGYAGLDNTGKVPSSQLPPIQSEVPTLQKVLDKGNTVTSSNGGNISIGGYATRLFLEEETNGVLSQSFLTEKGLDFNRSTNDWTNYFNFQLRLPDEVGIDSIGYADVILPSESGTLARMEDLELSMPISGGVLENYTEKLTALASGVINLNTGNVFTHTLSGNTTYSITNAVSGVAHSFTLIITQTSTVRTLTFPSSVKWQGGEIPDMSTASKTYVLTFMTVDGGTTWLGMFGGEF